jgi:hypothetical protein
MTPYRNLEAIQRTVKDVSMNLLSASYILNTTATFKSHPMLSLNPLIRLFPCHFPLVVKFKEEYNRMRVFMVGKYNIKILKFHMDEYWFQTAPSHYGV